METCIFPQHKYALEGETMASLLVSKKLNLDHDKTPVLENPPNSRPHHPPTFHLPFFIFPLNETDSGREAQDYFDPQQIVLIRYFCG